MAKQPNYEEIKKYFPSDVTQSVINDIWKQSKGDKEQVIKVGKGMADEIEEENKKVRQRKIQELRGNFKDLSEKTIEQALQENQWDVEKAIIPLFDIMQKQFEEERKKDSALRKEQERLKAKEFLNNMFSTIPDNKIQEILDENEGDVDATSDALLKFVYEQKKQKEKGDQAVKRAREEAERLQMERKAKVDSMFAHFAEHYITEQEVIATLEQNNWDSSVATTILLKFQKNEKWIIYCVYIKQYLLKILEKL